MSTDFFLSFFIWVELLHETFMGQEWGEAFAFFFFFSQSCPLSLNVMTRMRREKKREGGVEVSRIKFVLIALCSFGFG